MGSDKNLFSPVAIGRFEAKNRIFMAPITRGRAQANGTMGLAYVHLVEARKGMMHNPDAPLVHPHVRKELTNTPLIINGGYDLESANAAIAEGIADAVSFGAIYLANPDLVARFRAGSSAFNKPDFGTFYTPGERGYTDYPTA